MASSSLLEHLNSSKLIIPAPKNHEYTAYGFIFTKTQMDNTELMDYWRLVNDKISTQHQYLLSAAVMWSMTINCNILHEGVYKMLPWNLRRVWEL